MGGKQEVPENAKGIEELCFTLADEHFKREPDGDGKGNEQDDVGSSEKRPKGHSRTGGMMLEVLKKDPRATAELEEPVADTPRARLDISGGERAFIEAHEAKELLTPLTKPGNSYKRICFSIRSFGIGAANVAGAGLNLSSAMLGLQAEKCHNLDTFSEVNRLVHQMTFIFLKPGHPSDFDYLWHLPHNNKHQTFQVRSIN